MLFRSVYFDGIVPLAGKAVGEAIGYMKTEDAAGLDALLASGEGPIGTGVDEMQRNGAKEKPMKMSAEKQEWLLAHLSDMPLRGMVSPVTHGGDAIDKPVDYPRILGEVMDRVRHGRARAPAGAARTARPGPPPGSPATPLRGGPLAAGPRARPPPAGGGGRL